MLFLNISSLDLLIFYWNSFSDPLFLTQKLTRGKMGFWLISQKGRKKIQSNLYARFKAIQRGKIFIKNKAAFKKNPLLTSSFDVWKNLNAITRLNVNFSSWNRIQLKFASSGMIGALHTCLQTIKKGSNVPLRRGCCARRSNARESKMHHRSR